MREEQTPGVKAYKAPAKETMKSPYTRPVLRFYGEVRNLTQGSRSAGADADFTLTKNAMSDRRTKENIVHIGTHPLGIGLYLFDYKPEYRDTAGHGRKLGVMADEVEVVRPEAVHMHADGYKMVDYGMLN